MPGLGKNVLILTFPQGLGDYLMQTPTIRALKKYFKNTDFSIVVSPGQSDIFKNNPYVKEVIVKEKGLIGSLKFILQLRKKKFDSCICFDPVFTRILMAKIAGINRFYGYVKNYKEIFLPGKKILTSCTLNPILRTLKIINTRWKTYGKKLDFFLSEDEVKFAKTFLSRFKKKKIVVINPSNNWECRRWPLNSFIKLIKYLNAKGCIVIIIGKGREALEVSRSITEKTSVINMVDELTLGQLGALLKHCDLLITTDSGPMHIGAAVGAKMLSLFGPLRPEDRLIDTKNTIYIPLPCSPCILYSYFGKPNKEPACRYNFKCMRSIKVKDVIRKVNALLRIT